MKEDQFQESVARLLDHTKLNWWHTPNGGLRNKSVAAKLKRQGVKAGVLDIIIINSTVTGHKGLVIELKIGNNKLTPEQITWTNYFIENGYAVETCWTIDAVIKSLNEHFNLSL